MSNNTRPLTPPSSSASSASDTITTKGDEVVNNIRPAHVLFAASFPLISGAYLGYRRALHVGEGIASSNSLFMRTFGNQSGKVKNKLKPSVMKGMDVPAAVVASRALAIGSMLSIGGFGLLCAGTFYWSGCDSLEELVDSCREWAPRKLSQLESYFGIDLKASTSRQVEDVDRLAVEGMSEDEEVEYFTRKYVPELYANDTDDT
eukprot:CAMPEP_0195517624 /NCGR_PEP_ID=MMETSP0794_2-20130614/11097_1 /TAXON_ID=515487 /ORGANISM="Stephanopyxis turris, Strain CCMP 815" /LENGTH=203 /DNA_ID=CAMNT_0040646455 /DNA_START=13 /DNA_END=624 /DNA_ORIENTATION=+